MSPEDWEFLEQIKGQMQQAAELRSARILAVDQSPHQEAPRKTFRELKQAQEYESRLLGARTQEIGQEAEAALVELFVGDDAQAQTFQRSQLEALCRELAPPGSSLEECLLAGVVAKARFEAMMWSASCDQLALNPQSRPSSFHHLDAQSVHQTKANARSEHLDLTRSSSIGWAHLAEKRCLQALRELENLRRLGAPVMEVSMANVALLDMPASRCSLPLRKC